MSQLSKWQIMSGGEKVMNSYENNKQSVTI